MSDVLRDLAEDLHDLGADPAETDAVLGELGGLRDLAHRAPEPSAALAQLLGRPAPAASPAPEVARTPRRTPWARRSGVAGGVVVAVLSGVGATGLSAAANTLPTPLQERVSQFSRSYLPFQFPAPGERRPRGGLYSADGAGGRADVDGVAPDGSSPWVVQGEELPRVARPTRNADGGGPATASRPPAPGQGYAATPGPQQPVPTSDPSARPTTSPSATPSSTPSRGPSSSPSYGPTGAPSASPRPGQGGTRPSAGPRPFPTPRPGAGPAPTPAPAPSAPVSPDPEPSPGPSAGPLPGLPEPGEPLLPTPLLPLPGLDGDRQAPTEDVAP